MWGCLRESVDIIGFDTNCRKTNDQVARFAIEGYFTESGERASAANAASSVQPAADAASFFFSRQPDRVEIEKARQQTNNVPRQTETTFKG
jgi:hypothetical protein